MLKFRIGHVGPSVFANYEYAIFFICIKEYSTFYTARKASKAEQLESLSKKLGNFLDLGNVSFESWEDGLRLSFNLSKKNNFVGVLDEFQYLAESNEEILSVLQILLDECEDSKMKLIPCGSSISFMEGIHYNKINCLAERQPLSNRILFLLNM
ncbi:AAA family ATPase [Pseudothermotoga sp. U03pept]|uniref:AAA family ATPase n=1 Tax=Pseudothermotoga sp. U03pept TaxID=3447012 RepID=UPI003EFE7E1A